MDWYKLTLKTKDTALEKISRQFEHTYKIVCEPIGMALFTVARNKETDVYITPLAAKHVGVRAILNQFPFTKCKPPRGESLHTVIGAPNATSVLFKVAA